MLRKLVAAGLLAMVAMPALADIQFAKTAYSVNEAGGSISLSVIRTGSTVGAVSVSYGATIEGSDNATLGVDFTDASGSLTWDDGEGASKTINIPITNDNLVEGDETFTVRLNSAIGDSLGSVNPAVVTIVDDDSGGPAGVLSFAQSSYSISENAGAVSLTIRRAGNASGPAQAVVVLSPAGGAHTATAGLDYQDASLPVSWAAGDSDPKTVSVQIFDDALSEGDEQLVASLSGVSGASAGSPSSTTINIVDDDSPSTPPGPIQFSRADFVVAENGNNASDGSTGTFVDLSLAGGVSPGMTVLAQITPGTATAGVDYSEPSSFVVNANGAIRIPIINDTLAESTETFSVTLKPGPGYTLDSTTTATVQIVDDDSSGSTGGYISMSTPVLSVNEDAGVATVTVLRTGGSTGAVTLTYGTEDGSAVGGSGGDSDVGDYKVTSGTLTWGAGDLSPRTISVPINDDLLPEGDETFQILLSFPVGVQIGSPATTTVTIVDNENQLPGRIKVQTANVSVSETTQIAQVYVARVGGSRGPVSVDYSTVAGSATDGEDYVGITGTLKWDNGDSSVKLITVQILNDTAREATESFGVMLSGGSATIDGTSTATVSILDDDSTHGAVQFGATQYEAKAKSGVATLSVTRTGGTAGAASVTVQTVDGTAVSGQDYTGGSFVLQWADGDGAAKTVQIPIKSDAYSQDKKSFSVELTDADGVDIGGNSSARVEVRFERGAENTGCTMGSGSTPDPLLWLLSLMALGGLAYRRKAGHKGAGAQDSTHL